MSLPFLNTAPERTSGTRWGALTASLAKHGGEGGLDRVGGAQVDPVLGGGSRRRPANPKRTTPGSRASSSIVRLRSSSSQAPKKWGDFASTPPTIRSHASRASWSRSAMNLLTVGNLRRAFPMCNARAPDRPSWSASPDTRAWARAVARRQRRPRAGRRPRVTSGRAVHGWALLERPSDGFRGDYAVHRERARCCLGRRRPARGLLRVAKARSQSGAVLACQGFMTL